MKKSQFNRRDFNRLSTAAFGGLMAGTIAGCQDGGGGGTDTEGGDSGSESTDADTGETAVAAGDVNICRGLNACQGKGASGANDCAGQGTCATAEHHSCGGANKCKGQGGCGDNPGENECSGTGHCHVPLGADKWQMARDAFEARMNADAKSFGDAPEV